MPRPTNKRMRLRVTENAPVEQYMRVRIRTLEIPPVKDGILIGRSAPMGVESMMRTLKLMSAEHFIHIPIDGDPVVCDAVVRESVMRKLGEKRLKAFLLNRVKPLMAENELLMLDIDIEVVVEDTF